MERINKAVNNRFICNTPFTLSLPLPSLDNGGGEEGYLRSGKNLGDPFLLDTLIPGL